MTALPSPLVAPHVDLSNFEFMPLSVQRLRDSRIAAAASGDGFRAAVLLWCVSWHQVPSASLPDDDIQLAAFAGYGRVVSEWLIVKRDAMHGWVLCSDGRFYHPVVAEKAIEAWDHKAFQLWERECDRLRKDNKKRREAGLTEIDLPAKPAKNSGAGINGIPPESTDLSNGIPPENALNRTDLNRTEQDDGGVGRTRTDATAPATEAEPYSDAHRIGDEFIELRTELWPNESGFPAPMMTIRSQAQSYLDQGAPPQLIIEVMERGMRDAAKQGKTPTNSFAALKWSMANAIASHKRTVIVDVSPAASASPGRPGPVGSPPLGPMARAELARRMGGDVAGANPGD